MDTIIFLALAILVIGVVYVFAKQVAFGLLAAALVGFFSYFVTKHIIGMEELIAGILTMILALFGFIGGVKIANSI
ncbi:MAG TPA: hypothetical protein PLE99_14505 [Candidatus Thiothrix moscowensis]|uniref:hypothetical protein n=1 Tax=unclassified Thiothrix TaxID=2636184 RepID=UPI0025FE1710|nr:MULTISPECIES: hypothetical protein [unclassified Thiothrix]HRJ53966.1 hypothetical protein [Candidatus Thiothrix moscowensis]HRJ94048.1 hypothetical protein [Candidatus Thiothrix moscowensis]